MPPRKNLAPQRLADEDTKYLVVKLERTSPPASLVASEVTSIQTDSDKDISQYFTDYQPQSPLNQSHTDMPYVYSEPAKKKKKCPLNLTYEQEEDLVEWLQAHPMLYTKSLQEYKNTGKKQKLWYEKAQELNLENVTFLMRWYESMRTRLGKLSLQKSKVGCKQLTIRDNWILDKFDFLTKHISRVPSRQSVNRKAKIPANPSVTVESGSEVEDDDGVVHQPSASEFHPEPKPCQSRKVLRKKIKYEDSDNEAELLVNGLVEQEDANENLPSVVHTMLNEARTPVTSSRAAWGAWFTAMMPSLHDQVLNSFFRQSFELMMSHVADSDNIRAREMQQLHQQGQFSQHPQQQQFNEPLQQQQQTPPQPIPVQLLAQQLPFQQPQ